MNRSTATVWALSAGLCLSLAGSAAPFAVRAQTAAAQAQPGTPPSGDADTPGKMRVYKDPRTGRLGPPPPGQATPEALPRPDGAVSTESQDLVEVPSPVPGGGVEVDLKGRFRSATTATKEGGGNLKLECGPDSDRKRSSRQPTAR